MPFKFPVSPVTAGFTGQLVGQIVHASLADLDPDELIILRQSVLDWIGVTLAGAHHIDLSPLQEVGLQIAAPGASEVAGYPSARLEAGVAALLNGAASHVLDFDDTHPAVNGHASAPVLAAALALGQELNTSGHALLEAYAVGFTSLCNVAQMLGPDHFDRGFHVTATSGVIGAAAACARLLGLSAKTTEHALALAATQASGLQAVFGSPAKSFNVGRAAQSGLFAARCAKAGYRAREGVLDGDSGMAAAYSELRTQPERFARGIGGSHIRANLFKYHASCFLTHAAIEAIRGLRERNDLAPGLVDRCEVQVERRFHRVCSIDWPSDDLQGKFSLKFCAALALAGIDTARADSYKAEVAQQSGMLALCGRIVVVWHEMSQYAARVIIDTADGKRFEALADVSEPSADLDVQERRLRQKFISLNSAEFGIERCRKMIGAIGRLERASGLRGLLT